MKNTAMKIRCLLVLIAAAFAALPASAQLAPPNSCGRHDGAHPSVRERCGGAETILDGDDGRHGRAKRAADVDPVSRGLHHAAAGRSRGAAGGLHRGSLRLCVERFARERLPNGKRTASRSSRLEIRIRVTCTGRTAFAWNSLATLPFPPPVAMNHIHFYPCGHSRDAGLVRENVWRRAGEAGAPVFAGMDRLRRYSGRRIFRFRKGKRASFPRKDGRSIISGSM